MVVLKSIISPDSKYCVDVFIRSDGTFGFEEYRRDVEDYNRWFPIGRFSSISRHSKEAVFNEALTHIDWLKVI